SSPWPFIYSPIRAGNNGPENAGCKFFPVLRLVAGLPRFLPSRLKNTSPASKNTCAYNSQRPELVSSEGSLPRSHCASFNLCSLQLLLAVTCRATPQEECNPQTLAATLTGSPSTGRLNWGRASNGAVLTTVPRRCK